MKKVIQEFTETPNMSKWNNVPITKDNVVDYFSEFKYQTSEHLKTANFKTYIEVYNEGELVTRKRYDSEEVNELEDFLLVEILENMPISELFELPQFKDMTNQLIEYGKYVENGFAFIPTGLSDVKLYKTEQSIEGNLNEVTLKLSEDMKISKLVEKGLEIEYAEVIKKTDLADRYLSDSLQSGDENIIEYLKGNNDIDEHSLSYTQKHELNEIRLNKSEVGTQIISELKKSILYCEMYTEVEDYLKENNLPIKGNHELVTSGNSELTYDFKRTDVDEILRDYFDYDGYMIIESEKEGVPVYIDPQMLFVDISLEEVMKNFDKYNRGTLLQNIRSVFLDYDDDILQDQIEESIFTDLMLDYYGMHIAKERTRILTTDEKVFGKYAKMNKLMENIRDNLAYVPELANAILSPILLSNGKCSVEVDSIINNTTIEIEEGDTALYVSRKIAETIYDNLMLDNVVEGNLLAFIEMCDSKFENKVEAELMHLRNIAKRISGANGFQFDELDRVVETYSSMQTGEINIIGYLGSILVVYSEHVDIDDGNIDDVMQLLEVSLEYVNSKGVSYGDIPNFYPCLLAAIENPILDVVKYDYPSMSTTNMFGFEFDDCTDELKRIIEDATVEIIRPYYEHIVPETELSEIIYYQSGGVDIWTDYKFLNEDDTVCFRNLNWYEPQLDLNVLYNYAEIFEEQGSDNEHTKKLIEVLRSGEIPSYWSETGVNQHLYDKFTNLLPSNGAIKLNIENTQLEKLNDVRDASKLLYEYYNNGLCNAISFPDYTHWEQFYAEDINEFGEVEQEEVMSYEDYYDDELKVNSGYECESLDKVLNLIEDKRLEHGSDELFDKDIASILEANLTTKLQSAESIILELNNQLTITESAMDEVLNKIELNIENKNMIRKFDTICNQAYRNKNHACQGFINNVLEDDVLKSGLCTMINSNLSEVDDGIQAFQKITRNVVGANEEYKLSSNRVKEFFEVNSNINSDKLKVLLLSVEDIDNHISVGMDIGSGHSQLLQLANRERCSEININDICFMDTKSLGLAKEIIDMKNMSPDGIATNRLEMVNIGRSEKKLETEL